MDVSTRLLCLLLVVPLAIAMVSKEELLHKHLIDNYGQAVRPVANRSEPLVINATVYFIKLIGLREKEQEYEYAATLNLVWRDPKVKWDPASFGGYATTVISTKVLPIWLPDISLYNGVEMGDDYDYSTSGFYKILILSNGFVVWTIGTVFKTICLMDITYFPFDRQTCETRFISQAWEANGLVLQPRIGHVLTDYPTDNGEWSIRWNFSEGGLTNRVMWNGGNLLKSDFRVTMVLDRKHLFYTINIIAPCWIVSFLVLMVYCLPADAPEKVSLGITILLTFAVFQLMVAETLPRSAGVSVFAMYLLLQTMLSSVSVIMAVFSLYVTGSDIPLSPGPRSFVLHRLSRLVCAAQMAKDIIDDDHNDGQAGTVTPLGDGVEQPIEKLRQKIDSLNDTDQTLDAVLQKAVAVLDYRAQLDDRQDVLEKIARERYVWVTIADRFLFLVSAILLVLISAISFILLVSNHPPGVAL